TKRLPSASTTERVLCPIEPVEPRMLMLCIKLSTKRHSNTDLLLILIVTVTGAAHCLFEPTVASLTFDRMLLHAAGWYNRNRDPHGSSIINANRGRQPQRHRRCRACPAGCGCAAARSAGCSCDLGGRAARGRHSGRLSGNRRAGRDRQPIMAETDAGAGDHGGDPKERRPHAQ